MPALEGVLKLVRDARDNIECGQVNDAAWLLEVVEDDLAGCSADQGHRPAPHVPLGIRRTAHRSGPLSRRSERSTGVLAQKLGRDVERNHWPA